MVPCIAVFDIGKTNKKLLLFDRNYQIIKEEEVCLDEVIDEDGDNGEDLPKLVNWLKGTWHALEQDPSFDVQGVNFTTYGASLVHLNQAGEVVTPLYNYLKPFPAHLQDEFYSQFGSPLKLAAETASPALGMLNSGLQLYWLKYHKPALFKYITHTLHLPQYVSWLFTRTMATEYTSLGCHTALWNYLEEDYHPWVYAENLHRLFPPLRQQAQGGKATFRGRQIPAGLGLHDSSSALIPYLKQYKKPFLLLSTGTWGIALNPFARHPISSADLQQDCLHYLTYQGRRVRASRKFIGNAHEEQVKRLAGHFGKPLNYFKGVAYQPHLLPGREVQAPLAETLREVVVQESVVTMLTIELDLALHSTYEQAYHHLIEQLVRIQVEALSLAAEGDLTQFETLLVDGGFSRNPIFMALLQQAFPGVTVRAGKSAQGTALGAAMVLNLW